MITQLLPKELEQPASGTICNYVTNKVSRMNGKVQSAPAATSQWVYVDQEVNNSLFALLHEHREGPGIQPDEPQRGVTRRHWVPREERPTCHHCRLAFSVFQRHHHCRRCGDVFCEACSSYERRLNVLAYPDPAGKLYKVCKACFDSGPQTLGQSRDFLGVFKAYRSRLSQGHSLQGIPGARQNGITAATFRSRVNVAEECGRLRTGFEDSVTGNSFLKTLSDLKTAIAVPEWQKSPFYAYGKMSPSCSVCEKPFGVFRLKQLCVICGSAVCRGGGSGCSTTDLLVYMPDDLEEEREDAKKAKLTIIKIVGCPEREPTCSMYLRVCRTCRTDLEESQVQDYHRQRRHLSESLTERPPDFWEEFLDVDLSVRETLTKIDKQLPQYQELIETLAVCSSPGAKRTSGTLHRSNMQVLAKAQCDLGDHLTQLVMSIHGMKRLRPTCKGELAILKNFIRSKCEAYQETMFLFRDLKRKLVAVTPVEVLTCIQDIVDKQAINSCYLSIKQLTFEVLHLCSKHDLSKDVLESLVKAEGVVESELEPCVVRAGEDWVEHQDCVNKLLQIQLKSHRLVRPSRRLTKQYGARHVRQILLERSDVIIKQVALQMSAKCSDRSFRKTKQALREAEAAVLAAFKS